MNISMQSTNLNQQIYNKTAFKGLNINQPMVKEAVGLMAYVRCSYAEFEPSVIKRIATGMQQRLQAILNHQNKTGEMVLGASEINAVNGRITSLQKLATSKINLNA